MNTNIAGGNSSDKDNIDELSRFNYTLNDLDRISGLLFTAGLGISFHQADLTEESIRQSQTGEATFLENTLLNYTIAKELVDMSKINLIGSLLSLYTTTERLNQLFTLPETASAEERKRGREMVTLANILAVSAFTLAINGYELIADGILKQQDETPPP